MDQQSSPHDSTAQVQPSRQDFANWRREVSNFFAEVKCELAMFVAAATIEFDRDPDRNPPSGTAVKSKS